MTLISKMKMQMLKMLLVPRGGAGTRVEMQYAITGTMHSLCPLFATKKGTAMSSSATLF